MVDPTTLLSALALFPSAMYDAPISADATVVVTHAKVWKPEGLVIVLFCRNQTTAAVPGVSTTLDVPLQLMPLDATKKTFIVNLGPGETQQQVLSYTSQSVMTGSSIKGTFAYTGAVGSQKGFFRVSVVLLASDRLFLRLFFGN